jgi:hypothetical protein
VVHPDTVSRGMHLHTSSDGALVGGGHNQSAGLATLFPPRLSIWVSIIVVLKLLSRGVPESSGYYSGPQEIQGERMVQRVPTCRFVNPCFELCILPRLVHGSWH